MEKKVKAKRNKKAVSVHVRLSYVSAENLGEVIEPGNAKNFDQNCYKNGQMLSIMLTMFARKKYFLDYL